ncbi:arylsulfatase [Fusarium beomiforme]|uniref:Arylsulfatase n=1 Tax=Fusarium beomiforme TaxID=44412 RepID=A0A9P5A5M6_9HYPO|nr:arylsulfatase [Fusarium beomiforme]
MIMTDDQDRLLGSTDYQKSLHREFFDKGVELVNHFVTVAQCCPSRTVFLHGQHAHNTNVTHVVAPGGNYQKFWVSGESNDYLALWMQKTGYNTNYLGKFLNGYNTLLFPNAPPGFDHAELLVDPYTYSFGNVVLSKNGEQPMHYPGYHQTDVLRIKAIHWLNELLDNERGRGQFEVYDN